MKITVCGAGYVGMSNSVLLAQSEEVVVYDLDECRIDAINQRKSPIKDLLLEEYLAKKQLNLCATGDEKIAFSNRDLFIISTPTNFNESTNFFNTESIEKCLKLIVLFSPMADVVIKSTVPIGFAKSLRIKFQKENIFYSPEFLREGNALFDNLYPSRIIVGDDGPFGQVFSNLLKKNCLKPEVQVVLCKSTEAETIKLFSNTYLAMRVAFFNELDNFAVAHGLESKSIVEGVSLDPRIGDYYNNPSFGYGGYCLPKDTKQLKSSFEGVPEALISAIVKSNELRINFLADQIMNVFPKCVGIFGLGMKKGSDNSREASVIKVANLLKGRGVEVIVFDSSLETSTDGFKTIKNFQDFVEKSDLILANRISRELGDFKGKLYTRDIFERD